ncbi:MAG TPA: hypothetical protein VKB38_18895 [Terracidiphilus sp.]|nr:hypothetical protein [Terracidiphilus sp.]
MKQFLFTLMLYFVALSPLAAVCQGLPDDPAPAAQAGGAPVGQTGAATTPPAGMPDAEWKRVQAIAYGALVTVTSTYGPPVGCRFAGATDAYLLCDELDGPTGTGYRFDRDKVIRVDEERWRAASPKERNWHPGVLVAAGITGTMMGLMGARKDAGTGLAFGVIGAGIAGAIGLGAEAMNGSFAGAGVQARVHGARHRVRLRIHPRPGLPLPVRR